MIDLSLDHNVLINSEMDAAIQELNIVFSTETTELIGHPLFGTNFEQFLWQMTPAVDSLKQYISEKIRDTLFLSKFNTSIDINVVKGDIRMIYNIQINIKDNNTGKGITKKFQFK